MENRNVLNFLKVLADGYQRTVGHKPMIGKNSELQHVAPLPPGTKVWIKDLECKVLGETAVATGKQV